MQDPLIIERERYFDDIRFTKHQQWRITFASILFMFLCRFAGLSVFINLITMGCAIYFILQYQYELKKFRTFIAQLNTKPSQPNPGGQSASVSHLFSKTSISHPVPTKPIVITIKEMHLDIEPDLLTFGRLFISVINRIISKLHATTSNELIYSIF